MNSLPKNKAITELNRLGDSNEPFLFIINYDMNTNHIYPLKAINNSKEIWYSVNNVTNKKNETQQVLKKDIVFEKQAPKIDDYKKGFNLVKEHLKNGNTYLTNLTFQTPIKCNLSLDEIYKQSAAPYKLYLKDNLVVFSPETFIKIIDGKIYSYPMKGTIDASVPNAKEKILNNHKEAAEHATITDLIRNDLSMVATQINVDKYRYIDTLNTNQGNLLQVSSQISGILPSDYKKNLGDILFKLLPAGSISGAPKEKTLEIISEAENYSRAYYTGVFGIYDGNNLDCGVMIRYIEKQGEQYYFKSGGGVTINSNMEEEYRELIRKVYLPFNHD